jgi:ATP-dependent helicase/nuclease subunit B
LLHHFGSPANGYVSRAFPFKNSGKTTGRAADDAPYDHLARVFEWSATGGESDGEDDAEGDAGEEA